MFLFFFGVCCRSFLVRIIVIHVVSQPSLGTLATVSKQDYIQDVIAAISRLISHKYGNHNSYNSKNNSCFTLLQCHGNLHLNSCMLYIYQRNLSNSVFVLSICTKLYSSVFITVTPHASWRFKSSTTDCLFNSLFRRIETKISKFRITGPLWGKPAVTGGFPSWKASNTESVAMALRHVHFNGDRRSAGQWRRFSSVLKVKTESDSKSCDLNYLRTRKTVINMTMMKTVMTTPIATYSSVLRDPPSRFCPSSKGNTVKIIDHELFHQ